MWAFLASIAAAVGTVLQVWIALTDLRRNHKAEIRTWNAEAELMDELRWWRLVQRRRRYRQLVEMRSPGEHAVITRIVTILAGWVALMLAALFYLGDQIASNFF